MKTAEEKMEAAIEALNNLADAACRPRLEDRMTTKEWLAWKANLKNRILNDSHKKVGGSSESK